MGKLRVLLLLPLLACCADHRGEAGYNCRPDGTCISPRLECVNSGTLGGVRLDVPYCRIKESR